ncbi:LD-carboxypeptidase [Aspergillus piperis CBS 112811]|uniref:LD-carboxypeptidase n=1 Tax=Aspergillus piperis CBS 112811 TaxID=1448313 RepID=A0A8G1VJ49_9EURO|nr:LD-carboxypeptidase [Aspergillus piperis CBS 112811]RAH54335.1 LD-carboxypeptidase [Aspergillus piperis CBS 112811]
MDPIIPKALKKGDTIAFISPSARLNDILPAPLERGKAYLESLGFHVQVIFSNQTTAPIANSIRVRCEEIHAAFRDSTIGAIICTIGGAHANELLPFLDYSLIQSNPKIFPMEFTIDHFIRVLTEAGKPVGSLPQSLICSNEHSDFLLGKGILEKPRDITLSPPWRWLRGCQATGHLFGGTVPCVVRLQGTQYAPSSWKDKILFLESAMGDNLQLPYSVSQFRNNLVDLALSGILHEIRGLVVGRGYKYNTDMQTELANVILEVFEVIVGRVREEELPILMNVDFGHTSPFLTLPINALVKLDSDLDEFSVLEPGVQA